MKQTHMAAMPDESGAVLPILETLSRYRINNSCISSHEHASDRQFFKMGLYMQKAPVVLFDVKRCPRSHGETLQHSMTM